MRVIARPLAERETDTELLGLSVSIATAAALMAWRALHVPWPICLFHALTGHPCPTCGATRAAIAFFRGDLLTAWDWNPLALASYFAVLVFDIYALAVLITGTRRLRIVQVRPAEKKFLRGAIVAVVFANWLYLVINLPR
ncbi:MAG: DUF2752 domain-containing protein [Chthoniobacterales bacterium]